MAKIVKLTWINNSSGIDSQKLMRSVDAGAFELITTLPLTQTTYEDNVETIPDGSNVTYKVVSIYTLDGVEYSADSSTIIVTITPSLKPMIGETTGNGLTLMTLAPISLLVDGVAIEGVGDNGAESSYWAYSTTWSGKSEVVSINSVDGTSALPVILVQTGIQKITQWADVGYSTGLMDISLLLGPDIKHVPATLPSNLTNLSMMFSGAIGFNDSNVVGWDTSNVTNMNALFNGCYTFNQPIGDWDTSNVTNMTSMLGDNAAFNQSIDGWDVSKVTSARYLFSGCISLNSPITNLTFSVATDLSGLFLGCEKLNQDLSSCSFPMGENASGMFRGCTALNLPICTFGNKLTDVNMMFQECTIFNQDVSGIDMSSVLNMSSMFADCPNFNQDISGWDTSSVVNMSALFQRATAFNQNIGTWNVSKVTSFSNTFNAASSFNGDITLWDTTSLTNTNSMFQEATAFNQDISDWEFSNVTYAADMYRNATSLTPTFAAVPGKAKGVKAFIIHLSNQFVGISMNNQFKVYQPYSASITTVNGSVSSRASGNYTTPSNLYDTDIYSRVYLYTNTGEAWVNTLIDGVINGIETWNNQGHVWDGSADGLNSKVIAALNICADYGSSSGVHLRTLPATPPTNVTSLENLFHYCYLLELGDSLMGSWDMKGITSISNMFGVETYGVIPDLGGWDTSTITSMDNFGNGLAVDQNLSQWCVPTIVTEPIGWDRKTPENKPVWGTCPRGEVG